MIITSTGTTRRALTAQESNNVKEWLAINIDCLPKEITKNTWLSHLYTEQQLIHGEVDLYALATNYGTSPDVILYWYQELNSNQYASQLFRIIQRGD